jgi:hypothetical protein
MEILDVANVKNIYRLTISINQTEHGESTVFARGVSILVRSVGQKLNTKNVLCVVR